MIANSAAPMALRAREAAKAIGRSVFHPVDALRSFVNDSTAERHNQVLDAQAKPCIQDSLLYVRRKQQFWRPECRCWNPGMPLATGGDRDGLGVIYGHKCRQQRRNLVSLALSSAMS